MSEFHPITEPYDSGRLDVGDGNQVYWELRGNPAGKPAVVLHGGPGSGCGPFWSKYFDPRKYRVLLFDQRGCGRSTPSAGLVDTDLSVNTTAHLLRDIEALRERHGVSRWLVAGGSWGATLGLAYAQAHPEVVSELVLFSVTNTSRREVEWITRDMARVFPAEWAEFRAGVPDAYGDHELTAGYAALLRDPDPAVREQAALNWCRWEDTHVSTEPGYKPDPRYQDPRFRMVFARLVTHYWSNAGFLPDGQLRRDAVRLNGIPGALIHGKLDISGPADIAWHTAQQWTDAKLHLVGGAAHGLGATMGQIMLGTLDGYAAEWSG
jgi:proline iminopeptidase